MEGAAAGAVCNAELQASASSDYLQCVCRAQVRLSSLAENAFNAVERVDEFSHIPPEGNPPPPPPPSPSPRSTSAHRAGESTCAAPQSCGGGDQSDCGLPAVTSDVVAQLPPASEDRPRNRESRLPPARDPPEGFPREGRIEFADVKLRYRPGLPLVLKGLSFAVEAGHKVRLRGQGAH